MEIEDRQFQKSVGNEKPENQQKNENQFNSTTMKTMKNFAAQQLSKKAMNEVKGGWRCFVVTSWGANNEQNEGYWIEVPGNSASEAASNVTLPQGVGLIC